MTTKDLAEDITNYISYLESLHLQITIILRKEYWSIVNHRLSRFTIHTNPFCLAVKAYPNTWARCSACQSAILDSAYRSERLIMCHAGLEGFIFPLFTDKAVGYIHVGSFYSDIQKSLRQIENVARGIVIEEKKLEETFKMNVSASIPDSSYVKTLIHPLCHMMEGYIKTACVPGKSNDTILNKVVAYVSSNRQANLTLENISAACFCSPSSISHKFKKYYGCSISEYINRLRMKEAQNLLLNTNFLIKDIADIVGCSDSNYFTNVFKKITGISPKQYRVMHRTADSA